MTTVISVKFRGGSRLYYFSPGELEVNAGDGVIVETARGTEYGDVMVGIHDVPDDQVIQPLKEVIRVATDRDREMRDSYRAKEKDAYATCMERIQAHGLDMKLVDVEYTFNGSKIVFYFTADGRVDFRELVKDLASVFKTRIELRQIGVRDEAKMLGRPGQLRQARLLQAVPARLPARIHKDGQGTGPFPQPHQDIRHLRQAHVLPEIRTGRL